MGTSSRPISRRKHGSSKNSIRSQSTTLPTTTWVRTTLPPPSVLTFLRTKERALLLFVLRDHIGTTPLSNLAETLKKDLSNIWSSLSKPPGLESCEIEDYFDFQFTALTHKILKPDEFNQQVDSLRTRYLP